MVVPERERKAVGRDARAVIDEASRAHREGLSL
jgi:hypothetical protein